MSSTPASSSELASETTPGDSLTAKTFRCQSCGKEFGRRENLTRHLKTHDLVKPHRCAICQKEFTRSDLRQRHEATHNNSISRRRPSRHSYNTSPNAANVARANLAAPRGGPDNVDFRVIGPGEFAASNARDDVARRPNIPLSIYQPSTTIAPGTKSHGLVPGPQLNMQNHSYPELDHSKFDQANSSDIQGTTFAWPEHNVAQNSINSWFDEGFYSDLLETGTFWGNHEGVDFTNFTGSMAANHPLFAESQGLLPGDAFPNNPDALLSGRVSRVPSPPNEASEEDRWPYTWNPRSRDILTAKPIIIPDEHPLFSYAMNPKHAISSSFYDSVVRFISQSNNRGLGVRCVVMPALRVANLFIDLFFRHFESHMPVIHRASLSSMEDLPEPLIAVMIVIGSIYSNERHTRRFAIVLLDITRVNLQMSLEIDNSLMREPMIIYAAALICHAGLWCGNKRAFELAEVFRGAVVTYCRRNHFAGSSPSTETETEPTETSQVALTQMWKTWVAKELRKRLCWVVYSLDCDFPTLLHLPATISMSELAKIECPCDEEFWQAPSARRWKRLLGPASLPPSRNFVSAISPFIGPITPKWPSETPRILGKPKVTSDITGFDRLQPISLNSWSRFLVLITIHVHIFELSQNLAVARESLHEMDDSDNESEGSMHMDESTHEGQNLRESDQLFEFIQGRCGSGGLRDPTGRSYSAHIFAALAKRMDHLLESLSLWSKIYLSSPPSDAGLYAPSRHFHDSAVTLHELGLVYIYASVIDLQNALGKSGAADIPQAMSNLSRWANFRPEGAKRAALTSVRLSGSIATMKVGSTEYTHRRNPSHYDTIAFFISNVLLWAFASVATTENKHILLYSIREETNLGQEMFMPVIEKALSSSSDSNSSEADPRIIFRSAAEILTRLGSWGASLNLALLLHQRAQM